MCLAKKNAETVTPATTAPSSWPTALPVFRCPPDCGLCCRELLVECDALDVLREPRIQDVGPLRKTDHSLPIIDNCWLLSGAAACPFLDSNQRCGIYATRPSVCVGFPAGGTKCTELRQRAGMPALQATDADGSIIDRLLAELAFYGEN